MIRLDADDPRSLVPGRRPAVLLGPIEALAEREAIVAWTKRAIAPWVANDGRPLKNDTLSETAADVKDDA
jgi:hypothetical protein